MRKNYFFQGKMFFVLAMVALLSLNTQAQLYINEFMASNDAALPGPQGDYPDWIEIYNAGDEPVMLGGYFLSDDLSDPGAMFQIPTTYPDSVTVAAGGYIIFYANKGEASSVLNLDFKLSSGGEAVGFWTPESLFLDSLTYGEQTTNVSYGRSIDGKESWQFFVEHPVMGFTCSPFKSNITLKINEFVAKNNSGIQDEFGNYGDWIEIYNFGETELDITGMHMSDMVDNPTLYTFNPTVIPSETYLLVWCDGTDEDIITSPDTLHANFKLGAGGETILLSFSNNTIIDSLTFGAQTADISFGRYPDGTDDWVSFTIPTPRESNAVNEGPVITEVVREPMFPEFTDEVVITTNVSSSESGLIVNLIYNLGDGEVTVEMFDDGSSNDGEAGDGIYGASIPPMEKGAYIMWYIEASDDAPSTSFYPSEGSAAPLNYRVTDWTPVEVFDMPFEEPSGLTYNAQSSTLFTNNDGTTSNIYEISTSAELLNTFEVNGSDFEGIAFSSGYDTIFVVEEANWRVVMFDTDGNIIGGFDVDHSPNQVNGLEGITMDIQTGHIFVLGEKNNPELIELTVDGTELFRTELNFSPDVSGLTIHPVWQTLFIVSDEANSLNEVTKTGEFLRSWYIPLDQAEGVTFGEDEHTIYMVADRGGKLYNFDFNFNPFNPPASLFINEFMASNDFALPGPQGDYPDWIEIYNASDEAVMLGGYFMSDDLADPSARFQIPDTYPDSVTVAAGNYILFYANKGDASSVLNLNFKLGSSGEQVGLWNPEQIFVDSITYGQQTADTSFGRYQDGSDNWYLMPDFTPGETNVYVNSVEEIISNISLKQNYPNPFSGTTNIEFELNEPGQVTVTIYSVNGSVLNVLTDTRYAAGNHKIIWDASDYPAAYYFYSVKTDKSTVVKKATVIK